jgi:predicted RNase H-like HicB family nuclease
MERPAVGFRGRRTNQGLDAMKNTIHKTAGKKAKTRKKVRHVFPVVIEKDAQGYYASCPTLQGCFTDGDTLEEAMKNFQEVLQLHIEDRLECHEEIPGRDVIGIMSWEVKC